MTTRMASEASYLSQLTRSATATPGACPGGNLLVKKSLPLGKIFGVSKIPCCWHVAMGSKTESLPLSEKPAVSEKASRFQKKLVALASKKLPSGPFVGPADCDSERGNEIADHAAGRQTDNKIYCAEGSALIAAALTSPSLKFIRSPLAAAAAALSNTRDSPARARLVEAAAAAADRVICLFCC